MIKLAMAAAMLSLAIATPGSAQTVYSNAAVFAAQGTGTLYSYDLNAASTQIASPFALSDGGSPFAFAYEAATRANTVVNGTAFLQVRLEATNNFILSATGGKVIQSLGFDLMPYHDGTYDDFGERVTFSTNTGQTGTFTLPGAPTAGFVGISFGPGVTSVSFSTTPGQTGNDTATWFGTDNYRIYANAATPEPATWALMIGGFGVVGSALRRRRRVTTRGLAERLARA